MLKFDQVEKGKYRDHKWDEGEVGIYKDIKLFGKAREEVQRRSGETT